MQRNEEKGDSEDEIDMSKVGFRQTDGDGEERVIDSYDQILEEIDKVTYSKPNHLSKPKKEEKKLKNGKPAKPVAALVEAINESKSKYEENQMSKQAKKKETQLKRKQLQKQKKKEDKQNKQQQKQKTKGRDGSKDRDEHVEESEHEDDANNR